MLFYNKKKRLPFFSSPIYRKCMKKETKSVQVDESLCESVQQEEGLCESVQLDQGRL